jgi:hypothetical protein
MTVHPDDPVTRNNDPERTRSPAAWLIGLTFLIALAGALFLYDGRDAKTVPGPNTPNVVDNPAGSKGG